MAMKVLIVEDEIMAQKSLIRVLAQHFPDMSVVATTTSVKGTVDYLKNPANSVDVIFMDVELSDGVCFEIFRQVDVKAKVIMTTAYDSYALKAFEAGSIDYLLKPVDPEALTRAVSRCRARSEQIDVDALMKALGGSPAKKEYKERFIIKFNDRIVPLQASQIAYVYSEEKNNYLVILLKTIAMPLIMFGIFKVIGISGALLTACMISASVPSANNTVMFSAKYGKDTGVASKVVSLCSLVSVFTMPIMIALSKM